MLLLTGCAGPLGPPFGPGPEADSVFGILVILLFVGLLYRSSKGGRNPKDSRVLCHSHRAREVCAGRINARRVSEHDAGLVRADQNGI